MRFAQKPRSAGSTSTLRNWSSYTAVDYFSRFSEFMTKRGERLSGCA
jgi:hypothetical protein